MFPFPSSGGGAGGGAGGATAVESNHASCPFVARSYGRSTYDEELLGDSDQTVFRSTPVMDQIRFATSPVMSDRMSDTMEFVAGYSVSGRDSTSPSQLVRKVEFSSIAEDFQSSTMTNLMQFQPDVKNTPIFQQPTAATESETNDTTFGSRFVSTADRATPPLGTISEITQPDEQTILNRSATIKKESGEEDRHSPFGPILVQEPQTYQYKATKSELDEMEQLKWNIQQQVFQRYHDLKAKEVQWGSLEIRDSRVFFHPGKRREAIMREKKFHDATYKDGLADGDPSWYKTRQAQFAELMREFVRDETKHKQELMLAHLEKSSPFCKFPILGNRFILMRLLGKGGNGEVWEVIDYANKKQRCALKLSVSHRHAWREHYTHSRLCHQHIVGVGDSAYTIEYRQQLYTAFTVECVDSDLQQLIEMFEHFDETSALKVLYQLLTALTYLHDEMKIAHYDLKPTNILVGRDECVKLTDFDLARNVNEPIVSSVVGTLRYLPPECFRPNFGDCQGTAEKADIWMVGVVYCVMLWGKHPIVADKASHDEARAMLGRYNGTLHYPREVSDLSRWIIQGCLHPDPRCRPSAFQLLQALQNAAARQ
ncbi:hypothetical protein Poli38472_007431 [Pythium oligandrum]|uniref:Protein kinase domain-containing protein n=1 Tax=Pythium oligandrum TaxID=41045 RepID=A0A8K1CR71_PYTOL|nr:hypothetical protein Poli38472_007431 [Pythium oligandrum]|eukprot:TMW67759.1 hypothetical protein Poli38472_007431 [Pythium oligandrum]